MLELDELQGEGGLAEAPALPPAPGDLGSAEWRKSPSFRFPETGIEVTAAAPWASLSLGC